jgi:hypothetical protein
VPFTFFSVRARPPFAGAGSAGAIIVAIVARAAL